MQERARIALIRDEIAADMIESNFHVLEVGDPGHQVHVRMLNSELIGNYSLVERKLESDRQLEPCKRIDVR